MTTIKDAQADEIVGAVSHNKEHWHAIDWPTVYQEVRRLQVRIVKAQQEGKPGKVKALQHLLTHSFSGKDTLSNLLLLHPNCHRQVHSQKLDVVKPRPARGGRKA